MLVLFIHKPVLQEVSSFKRIVLIANHMFFLCLEDLSIKGVGKT